MKPRTRYIATGLVIAAVAAVGLGARDEEGMDRWQDPCGVDLDYTFEICSPERARGSCEPVRDEFAAACQAGCVMALCPAQTTCTGLDPMWCGSCADMHAAPFWAIIEQAESRVDAQFQRLQQKHDQNTAVEWLKADVEQRCPELKGTEWYSQYRATIKP